MTYRFQKNMQPLTDKQRDVVANHIPFLLSVLKRMNLHGLDFEDCVQAGTIGMMRAVQIYDPTKGYRFSTYAFWWIRAAIFAEMNGNLPVKSHHNRYQENLRILERIVYLDEPKYQEGNICLLDFLLDKSMNPEERMAQVELAKKIDEISSRLPRKKITGIVWKRNIINCETLQSVGDDMHLSRERIRQIKEGVKKSIQKELAEYR